jgi:hypothetical protein
MALIGDVDGDNESSLIPFAELPKGRGTFTDVTLSKDIANVRAIQWDGKHLAVGYGGIDSQRDLSSKHLRLFWDGCWHDKS